jgi:hypothetical protein
MPAASKPLQTSASDLKAMLAKTGRSLKQGDNWDKLEVLCFLADQISDKLKRGGKIKLTLSDLNAFLSREGMPQDVDVKGIISKIFQLVHYQYERLGQHVQPKDHASATSRNMDALDSLLALVVMEGQRVHDCFEPEVVPPPREDVHHEKRPRVADTPNSVVEPPTKRPCLDTVPPSPEASMALLPVPKATDLLAELKRLVPINMFAIEDVNKSGAPTDSFLTSLAAAQKEAERILQADLNCQPILWGNNGEERRVAFRRIVLLLHPDLGYVSGEDSRAIAALELSLKAFVKSELACAV